MRAALPRLQRELWNADSANMREYYRELIDWVMRGNHWSTFRGTDRMGNPIQSVR